MSFDINIIILNSKAEIMIILSILSICISIISIFDFVFFLQFLSPILISLET